MDNILQNVFELFNKGNYSEGLELCNKHVESINSATCWHLLALLHFKLENFDASENAFKKALALDKDTTSIKENLSSLYITFKQYKKNLDFILTLKGTLSPILLLNRGVSYLNLQQYSKAHNDLISAANSGMESSLLLLSLAKCYELRNESNNVLLMYDKALHYAPNDIATLNNYALFLAANDKADEAEKLYLQALKTASDSDEPLMNLVELYKKQKNIVKAINFLKHNVDSNQIKSSQVKCLLGLLYQFNGEMGKALEIASRLKKNDCLYHYNCFSLMLKTDTLDVLTISTVAEQFIQKHSNHKAKAHFELAHWYDKHQNYKNAYQHFNSANSCQQKNTSFSKKTLQSFTERIKMTFDSPGEDSCVKSTVEFTPIFIVGLPRSGSSLLEQVLIQHSKISTLGESDFLTGLFAEIRNYPDKRPSLALCNELKIQYTNYIYDSFNTLPSHLINKLPSNIWHIGFLKQIFPNAKFILIQRSLKDTALSIWQSDFSPKDQPYAFTLNHIIDYIECYLQMDSHYKDIFYKITYEQFIINFENSVAMLLEYLGVPFEKKCLQFYNSNITTYTASNEQVRKNIYTSSIGKYKYYYEFMPDFFDAIEKVEFKYVPELLI